MLCVFIGSNNSQTVKNDMPGMIHPVIKLKILIMHTKFVAETDKNWVKILSNLESGLCSRVFLYYIPFSSTGL